MVSRLATQVDGVIERAGRAAAPVAAAALKKSGGAPSRPDNPATSNPGEEPPATKPPGVEKKDVAVLAGAAMGMYAKNFPPGVRPIVNKTASTGAAVLNKTARAGLKTGTRAGTIAAGVTPAVRTARKVAKTVDRVSSAAGNIVGAKSATAGAGEVMQEKRTLFFFKSKTPVSLWKSSLTGALNRQDVVGTSRFTGKNVVSSDGVMFKTDGKTWHRGTTVVKTGQGEKTMTHLRSLNIPNNHYYFNRPVSDKDAVGIAAGQTRPEKVTGFAGQVSATEGLCPGWAGTKHALIKTQLHWATDDKG
jgi:hypothetical protein